MGVTRAEVEHVARLARLQFDDAEVGRLVTELGGIIEHMTALRSADTEGVEPLAVAASATAAPRPDLPGADAAPVDAAAFATGWRDGFFTVPLLTAQSRPRPPAEP
jgi:aspartyl-tRNA(Asn)/glutamyl-tRNA(Gln) amidotransferase subunit C